MVVFKVVFIVVSQVDDTDSYFLIIFFAHTHRREDVIMRCSVKCEIFQSVLIFNVLAQ